MMYTFKELSKCLSRLESFPLVIGSYNLQLKPGTVNIVAAPPAMGKTAFLHFMVYLLQCQQNVKQLFVTTQTTELDTYKRMCNTIIYHERGEGFVGDNSAEQFPLLVNEEVTIASHTDTWEELLMKIEHQTGKNKTQILFIDQLQGLYSQRKFRTRKDELIYIAHQIRQLAMQKELCIILSCSSKIKIPKDYCCEKYLNALNDNGVVSDLADNILLLNRYDYFAIDVDEEGNDIRGLTECYHIKNSEGDLHSFQLNFNRKIPTYKNWDIVQEESKNEALKKLIDTFDLKEQIPLGDDDSNPI